MSITRDLNRATKWVGQGMATQSRTRAATIREQAHARGLGVHTGVAPGQRRSGKKAISAMHATNSGDSGTWGAEFQRSAILIILPRSLCIASISPVLVVVDYSRPLGGFGIVAS
eukprot:6195746-Pleurochrysis_carterae.AAC.5